MGCACLKRAPIRHPAVPSEFMDKIQSQTTLSRNQIQYLYNRFCQFAGSDGHNPPTHLHKYNFYSGVLQLNPLLPTILNCMFDGSHHINFVAFALFLSTFQANSLKTQEEVKLNIKERKLKLLFALYDHNKDGHISKVDLAIVVHKLFSNLLDHKQITRIVHTMMEEMDQSQTHQIHFPDFCKAFEAFDMTEMLVTRIPEFRGHIQ